ncbi:MAG: hypothetical protein ABJH04_06480 [Cyclobacteriaceae bacterium]
MKNLSIFILFLSITFSCVDEDAPEVNCGKWEVEINNPEATVKVENGFLIVDIENPKSNKDVRLIQRQSDSDNHPDIAIGIDMTDFQWTGVDGGASRDAQISASVAYKTSPDSPILTSVYGADKSTFYVEGAEVFSRMQGFGRVPNEVLFFAKGEAAAFERDARTFPMNLLSVTPKVVYIDFGIDPSITRQNPTQSIHYEIDIIKFEQYTNTQNQIVMVTGTKNGDKNYGLAHDTFECNSLK